MGKIVRKTSSHPDFGICKVVLDAVVVSSGKLLSEVRVTSFILILPVCVIVVDLGVAVSVFLVSRPSVKQN